MADGIVTVKNRMPQAIPTLVMDAEKGEYTEKRVPPRSTMDIPEPLSSLTEAQIANGVLKRKAQKGGA